MTSPLPSAAILLALSIPSSLPAQFASGFVRHTVDPMYAKHKFGAITKEGRVAIPFDFDKLDDTGGLLIAWKGEKAHLFLPDGKPLPDGEYDSAEITGDDSVRVLRDHRYGLLGPDGKQILPPKFHWIGGIWEGLVPVQQGERWGWIDLERDKGLYPTEPFDFLDILDSELIVGYRTEAKEAVGFHRDGRFRFRIQVEDWCSRLENGVFNSKRGGVRLYFDADGHEVPAPEAPVKTAVGLTPFREKERVGFKDSAGKVIIPAQFEGASEFLRGTARARKDGRMGLIDEKGSWVVPPEFETILRAGEGGVRVGAKTKESGEWFLLNGAKVTPIPGKYFQLWSFGKHGLAVAAAF